MWKNYYSVTRIDEAIDLLNRYQERARIIAGATDLILEIEQNKRPGVDTLIDVTRVPDLDQIWLDKDVLHLGPLVTHNHVVGSQLINQHAFPLAQACWEVGAPQIRNRATVAGNLITASPANDTITPLWALGASVTLRSSHGERTVPLPDFYTGLRATVMRPDEMMTAIHIPVMQENQHGTFIKLGLRMAQAISVVNVTVILTLDGEQIADARITLGSVAPTIISVPAAEDYLKGRALSSAVIAEAARLASSVPTPIDDVRAPAVYRTEMVRVLTARALRQIRDRNYRAAWPQNPAMLWGPNQGIISEALPALLRHERDAGDTIVTTINGKAVTVTGSIHKTLLDFLREDVGLTGSKEGCAEGECGACTVFLDGMAVMACMVPAPRAHGAEIVTIEGLSHNGHLHPLQQAFVETGAVQCGFCTPGFLMSGAMLLDEYPQPSAEQIAQSISGNLCRCTGYYKIIDAFNRVGQEE